MYHRPTISESGCICEIAQTGLKSILSMHFAFAEENWKMEVLTVLASVFCAFSLRNDDYGRERYE
jgi:hypothetical protein